MTDSYIEFKEGYVAALEWLTIDCPDWQLDQMREQDDSTFKEGYSEKIWQDGIEWNFSQCALNRMEKDCQAFYLNNIELLKQAIGKETDARNPSYKYYDWSQAGHDYWLTRNGHGVGFWDRGLGSIGDKLSQACQYDEVYAYLGDDNLVYIN